MRSHKKFRIGLTFGAYELFHTGHFRLLKNAKKYCDFLIVCVSSDDYMMKYKGHKSVIPLKERMEIVREMRCVDWVDVQSLTFGKKEAIRKYRPSVLFVGSDHKRDYAGKGLGVPIKYLPHTDGISSTILRKKLSNV